MAVLAYSALRAYDEARYQDWFAGYARFLYVLAASTRVITRRSENAGKNSAVQALHNAVKAAQSRMIELIQAELTSGHRAEGVLFDIWYSKLEFVGGISDQMLDAMVDCASSATGEGYQTHFLRKWVFDLKFRREQRKVISARI